MAGNECDDLVKAKVLEMEENLTALYEQMASTKKSISSLQKEVKSLENEKREMMWRNRKYREMYNNLENFAKFFQKERKKVQTLHEGITNSDDTTLLIQSDLSNMLNIIEHKKRIKNPNYKCSWLSTGVDLLRSGVKLFKEISTMKKDASEIYQLNIEEEKMGNVFITTHLKIAQTMTQHSLNKKHEILSGKKDDLTKEIAVLQTKLRELHEKSSKKTDMLKFGNILFTESLIITTRIMTLHKNVGYLCKEIMDWRTNFNNLYRANNVFQAKLNHLQVAIISRDKEIIRLTNMHSMLSQEIHELITKLQTAGVPVSSDCFQTTQFLPEPPLKPNSKELLEVDDPDLYTYYENQYYYYDDSNDAADDEEFLNTMKHIQDCLMSILDDYDADKKLSAAMDTEAIAAGDKNDDGNVLETKKKPDKERKKAEKKTDQFMKSIVHLSMEEKLDLLTKKHTDAYEELRTYKASVLMLQRRIQVLENEKTQLQNEQSKSLLARSRLEALCRELQKQNKTLKEESLQKIREEEEKRKEVSTRFQTALNEVTQLMQQNTDKNLKLRDDNLEISNKFRKMCEQFKQRDQEMNQVKKQLDLERQLAEANLKKIECVQLAEQETWNNEREKLITEIKLLTEEKFKLETSLKALQDHLSMYTSKFGEFETTINKSNQVFDTYKAEMSRLTKQANKLEKECSLWKERFLESSRHNRIFEEKNSVLETAVLDREKRIERLGNLCRVLQEERLKYLSQLKEAGLAPKPNPEPSQGNKSAKGNKKISKKEKEIADLNASVLFLQQRLNAVKEASNCADHLMVNDDQIAQASTGVSKLVIEENIDPPSNVDSNTVQATDCNIIQANDDTIVQASTSVDKMVIEQPVPENDNIQECSPVDETIAAEHNLLDSAANVSSDVNRQPPNNQCINDVRMFAQEDPTAVAAPQSHKLVIPADLFLPIPSSSSITPEQIKQQLLTSAEKIEEILTFENQCSPACAATATTDDLNEHLINSKLFSEHNVAQLGCQEVENLQVDANPSIDYSVDPVSSATADDNKKPKKKNKRNKKKKN